MNGPLTQEPEKHRPLLASFFTKLKYKIGPLAHFMGFDNLVNVKASNVVCSIPERCWPNATIQWESLRSHLVEMPVIRHAGVESYQYHSALPPAFRTEWHFARRHVYRFQDVLVHPRTGACRVVNDMLQESYGSLRECLNAQPFPSSHGKLIELHGLATCIKAASFYHFLLEDLPRLLWMLALYPDVNIYLPAGAPRHCRDMLDLMVERKIIREYQTLRDDSMVKMADYVFTQAEALSGFVHSSDLCKLRNTFIPTCANLSDANDKIFISRRNTGRIFDNQQELEEALTSAGYRIVCLEDIPFESQIKLLQNAMVVVAAHGAGLANLVWCQRGTRVLEIFSPRLMNDCYARLSSTLGLDYAPLWASNTPNWGAVNIDQLRSELAL